MKNQGIRKTVRAGIKADVIEPPGRETVNGEMPVDEALIDQIADRIGALIRQEKELD